MEIELAFERINELRIDVDELSLEEGSSESQSTPLIHYSNFRLTEMLSNELIYISDQLR